MNKGAEYIYQIYKEGGFNRAAQKLYVSQPALSAIVRRTEAQLHTQAFRPFQKTYPIDRSREILYRLH